MEGTQQPILNRLTQDRIACSLDKKDLRRLLGLLQERVTDAAELEVANFQQLGQTDEDYERNKVLLREAYDLRVTATGYDGKELYGTVSEVFDSPNFPINIRSLFVSSETLLRGGYNVTPRNGFELFFDFSKPAVFDFSFAPSHPTPNETSVKVRGIDAAWTNGLFREVQQFLSEHRSQGTWLHQHTVYDLLLWTLGLPIALWACLKASPWISTEGEPGPFIEAALYLYVAFAVVFGFRALFHYARWVFPYTEYKSKHNRTGAHKAFLGALTLGLVGSFLYDVLKYLIWS